MSKWISFKDQEPPRDCQPKLIVWYKGKERKKQLAVAWRAIEELIAEHRIGTDDELGWWCELTDPDELNNTQGNNENS